MQHYIQFPQAIVTMTELEPAGPGAQEHVSFLKVVLKFRPADSQYIVNIANQTLSNDCFTIRLKVAKHSLTVEYAVEYINT